jgi:hypothetical protein
VFPALSTPLPPPPRVFLLFCFSSGTGFEFKTSHLQSRQATTWVTPPVCFVLVNFGDGVSKTICPGWSQTMIFSISASQVARITGVSHLCPAL